MDDLMREIFGEVISSYSRAQAIEDGVLVNISPMAREAGIKFPVAMTSASYAKCVALPEDYKGEQDINGRLWDVVWMLLTKIRTSRGGSDLLFKLHVKDVTPGQRGRLELVTLRAVCGPGDDAEPVITIMLPEED